jgi:hypothetical protein
VTTLNLLLARRLPRSIPFLALACAAAAPTAAQRPEPPPGATAISRNVRALTGLIRFDVLCSAQLPQIVQSTFEVDLDGWTHSGAGGNPGGRLYIDNSEGPVTYIYAPAKFRGNLSAYESGYFTFDGLMVGTGGAPWTSGLDYGHVWISNGGTSMFAELAPTQPSTANWESYFRPLFASDWGVSGATFDAIMANVTAIRISVEALFGAEIQAIDNVRLEPWIPMSSCTVFNGNDQNPVDFACVTFPILGTSWQSWIGKPAGTLATTVAVAAMPSAGPTPDPFVPGELLINIVGAFVQVGNGNHSFALPASPSLLGVEIDTQGFRIMQPFEVPALNGIRLKLGG